MKRYPPSLRELHKGDRLVLISLDNSRNVIELTGFDYNQACAATTDARTRRSFASDPCTV